MALNIRDEKTDSLAREVAGVTGESLTDAIGTALRERLERLQREGAYERRKARIDELTTKIRANLLRPVLVDEDLYDEAGLPKEDR